MDANSGEPWSEMDISDLANEFAHGRTMAETASFLCRDDDEVQQKAMELGLVAQSPSRLLAWLKAARKPRRVVFVGYVAGGAGHAGAPAAAGLRTVPRPLGMILAHPARAIAARAFRPLTSRLGT